MNFIIWYLFITLKLKPSQLWVSTWATRQRLTVTQRWDQYLCWITTTTYWNLSDGGFRLCIYWKFFTLFNCVIKSSWKFVFRSMVLSIRCFVDEILCLNFSLSIDMKYTAIIVLNKNALYCMHIYLILLVKTACLLQIRFDGTHPYLE